MTRCILIKKNTNIHPQSGLLKLLRYCCLKMVWHYTQLIYLEVDTEELYKIIPSPLSLESQHQIRLNIDLPSCPNLKFHLFSSQTKGRKRTFSLSYLCSGVSVTAATKKQVSVIWGIVWMRCISPVLAFAKKWQKLISWGRSKTQPHPTVSTGCLP